MSCHGCFCPRCMWGFGRDCLNSSLRRFRPYAGLTLVFTFSEIWCNLGQFYWLLASLGCVKVGFFPCFMCYFKCKCCLNMKTMKTLQKLSMSYSSCSLVALPKTWSFSGWYAGGWNMSVIRKNINGINCSDPTAAKIYMCISTLTCCWWTSLIV